MTIRQRYIKAQRFLLTRFVVTREIKTELFGYYLPVITWQWVETNAAGEPLYELPPLVIPVLKEEAHGKSERY